jgi:hypothetical protein
MFSKLLAGGTRPAEPMTLRSLAGRKLPAIGQAVLDPGRSGVVGPDGGLDDDQCAAQEGHSVGGPIHGAVCQRQVAQRGGGVGDSQ